MICELHSFAILCLQVVAQKYPSQSALSLQLECPLTHGCMGTYWNCHLQENVLAVCAGCTTLSVSEKHAEKWQASTLPSAVTIPTTSPVTSATVHLYSDEIVVGTEQGALLLLAAAGHS